MIGNLTSSKRFLTLLVVSLLLAACRADQTPPNPNPASSSVPVTRTASPSLAGTASPAPSATATFAVLEATHTLQAASPSLTPTPSPRPPGFAWCPESCFHVSHQFPLERPIPVGVAATYRYASTQNGNRELHRGVEFPSASGTPVLAAAPGRVAFAGDDMDEKVALWPEFYGNYVVIRHEIEGQQVFTLYAHLSRIDVGVGQIVEAGQEIGLVGATGSAIGSHLHFEVRYAQNTYFSTRNPELWFAPLEGAGALAGRIYDPNHPNLRGAIRIQRMENGQISNYPAYYSMEIYPSELLTENGENFALNDLPAGQYRLTYLYNGLVYERFVEIQPGILTLVTIVLD